jgi:hypothetical protein
MIYPVKKMHGIFLAANRAKSESSPQFPNPSFLTFGFAVLPLI